MLAEERFSLIMEQLNRKRTVTVQELCEALNTSESTIRRDLTELDRLGKLCDWYARRLFCLYKMLVSQLLYSLHKFQDKFL